jgi:hypothetical protein
VKTYEDAFNRRDLDAVVAIFTDNATFNGAFWLTAFYKKEIRDQHDYVFARNQVIQNTECTVVKDTVNCKLVVNDDCITSAGMDGLHFPKIEFVFDAGKIYKVTHMLSNEDSNPWYAFFFVRMPPWGQKNRTEEYNKLFNGSTPIYTHETGEITAKLCKDYAATNP